MSVLRLLPAVALLASASACTDVAPSGGSAGVGEPRPADRIHRQAHDALIRWADGVRESGGASITFVGDPTSTIGSWEDGNAANEAALAAGRIESMTDLPADRPARTDVRWTDGTTVQVNVLSAAATLADLVATATGDCPDCEPLRITDARLARGLVETADGPAEAPLWVFTIDGSSVRVTRLAVDKDITVDPPPWSAGDPPAGISVAFATGEADSRRLNVAFLGAAGGAEEPCGAEYETEAVESELAVVVIVVEHRNPATEGCAPASRLRSAEVTLESRLGDRTVLEVRQGLPVAVHAPAS